jgi:hypothetical protein
MTEATPEEDAKIIVTDCTCDFSCGRRGMDRCPRCGGTGSMLRVDKLYWPNNERGYMAALTKVRETT